VSLAFLELFLHESSIDQTMTANDVVNAHVKPHTKRIGEGGSGAYVELIGDGEDSSGHRWCGTPTHMLSYSWSYTMATIVAGLRKFEHEHPPSKGECYWYFVDQFALNQHAFAKDCTQKQTEDMMLATLKESIRVPAQMICLLHPWQDPVPFRRVWCLFELYIAITLGAKVIMHFPPEDAKGFYSKLRSEEAVGKSTALVPTIAAKEAQATVESDRVRIMQEITDSIGMDQFNAQLQEYLERAMRAAATDALVERGGVESVALTGGSKPTMEMLRRELEQVKQALAKAQEETQKGVQETKETKKEVQKTKKGVMETKEQVQETKKEVQETRKVAHEAAQELVKGQEETKQELAVLAAVQEVANQRMTAIESKMDTLIGLLKPGGGEGT
jgi:hypothetical protein